MAGLFAVAPLDPDADRSGFESGVEPLDSYFKTQVTQDIKRRVTACFTALDGSGQLTGFTGARAWARRCLPMPCAGLRPQKLQPMQL